MLNMPFRPTPLGCVYALGVAALATNGFTTESTAAILLAAAATLPMSLVALPAYYVAYGLLAQVPGANPSTSSTSASGDLAPWFAVTSDVLGVLALTAAALLNVAILVSVTARGLDRGPARRPERQRGWARRS